VGCGWNIAFTLCLFLPGARAGVGELGLELGAGAGVEAVSFIVDAAAAALLAASEVALLEISAVRSLLHFSPGQPL
jgi:hypothetical protein